MCSCFVPCTACEVASGASRGSPALRGICSGFKLGAVLLARVSTSSADALANVSLAACSLANMSVIKALRDCLVWAMTLKGMVHSCHLGPSPAALLGGSAPLPRTAAAECPGAKSQPGYPWGPQL